MSKPRKEAEEAYLLLLKLPHEGIDRHYLQQTLCDLRDYIAWKTGKSREQVQNEYEAIAEGYTP